MFFSIQVSILKKLIIFSNSFKEIQIYFYGLLENGRPAGRNYQNISTSDIFRVMFNFSSSVDRRLPYDVFNNRIEKLDLVASP